VVFWAFWHFGHFGILAQLPSPVRTFSTWLATSQPGTTLSMVGGPPRREALFNPVRTTLLRVGGTLRREQLFNTAVVRRAH